MGNKQVASGIGDAHIIAYSAQGTTRPPPKVTDEPEFKLLSGHGLCRVILTAGILIPIVFTIVECNCPSRDTDVDPDTWGNQIGDYARRSSAEHLIATKALRCTATAWILTVAESFAKF